jgi:hypothetical protein
MDLTEFSARVIGIKLKVIKERKMTRKSYYEGLAADYSKRDLVPTDLGDRLIKLAEDLIKQQETVLPPYDVTDEASRFKLEQENKEWWTTHCEALRQGRGDILTGEYRKELVYFCQDGPFRGRDAGTTREQHWWAIIAQPGVTMTWPIVMFEGEVVYFEWKCLDNATEETIAKGSVTFLRRGHRGGVYLKTEQLTFYRDVFASPDLLSLVKK